MLGAFGYSRNETLLHTDARVLPAGPAGPGVLELPDGRLRRRRPTPVQVSYWMNRLQRPRRAGRLPGHAQRRPTGSTPARCCAGWSTSTPIYTPASVAAQRRLPELNTGRTAFAGAYHGWGFHEDGCASGVRAAAAFGAGW